MPSLVWNQVWWTCKNRKTKSPTTLRNLISKYQPKPWQSAACLCKINSAYSILEYWSIKSLWPKASWKVASTVWGKENESRKSFFRISLVSPPLLSPPPPLFFLFLHWLGLLSPPRTAVIKWLLYVLLSPVIQNLSSLTLSSSPGPVAPRRARTFWVSSLPRPSTLENLKSTLTLLTDKGQSSLKGWTSIADRWISLTSSTPPSDTTGSETQRLQTNSHWTEPPQVCSVTWDLPNRKDSLTLSTFDCRLCNEYNKSTYKCGCTELFEWTTVAREFL